MLSKVFNTEKYTARQQTLHGPVANYLRLLPSTDLHHCTRKEEAQTELICHNQMKVFRNVTKVFVGNATLTKTK